jgi:hypothetical protein
LRVVPAASIAGFSELAVARCSGGISSAAPAPMATTIADGRPTVIAAESTVAAIFVIVAATAVTALPWLLVLGGPRAQRSLAALPQVCREQRWWPPFCLVVDWIAAAIIATEILAGVHFH